jgi:hypothetical protein
MRSSAFAEFFASLSASGKRLGGRRKLIAAGDRSLGKRL